MCYSGYAEVALRFKVSHIVGRWYTFVLARSLDNVVFFFVLNNSFNYVFPFTPDAAEFSFFLPAIVITSFFLFPFVISFFLPGFAHRFVFIILCSFPSHLFCGYFQGRLLTRATARDAGLEQ